MVNIRRSSNKYLLKKHAHKYKSKIISQKKTCPPFKLEYPVRQKIPFVFSSPHSGRNYPNSFVMESRLDLQSLRGSEDCFVDDLFSMVPSYGAPFLQALLPRAYIDFNRSPNELDQRMFKDSIPEHFISKSPRVTAGLGIIPRIVSSDHAIYDGKISFKEAHYRIKNFYLPYHAKLNNLIQNTKTLFGKCILIDCHSMPSLKRRKDSTKTNSDVDIVLGNKYNRTCSPKLISLIETFLKESGLQVRRNTPYAGGYTTQYYGNPKSDIHTLQIEINRGIYMNEKTFTPINGFFELKVILSNLMQTLSQTKLTF